jgi:hypothetical protein
MGLTIERLENPKERKLQDLVLTVHHCYMFATSNTPIFKIIENHARLALYFPDGHLGETASIGPNECRTMGRAMSDWYFARGGLLLSVEAQKAYFKLARALTRASSAKALDVPNFPNDEEAISKEKIGDYQKKLGLKEIIDHDDIEKWSFGSAPSETQTQHRDLSQNFKDFVFLAFVK